FPRVHARRLVQRRGLRLEHRQRRAVQIAAVSTNDGTSTPKQPPIDPSILRHEIGEQPEVLARVLERERANVARLSIRWRRADIQYLTIVARGSSDNAASYAKYMFGALADLSVVLAAPSLYTLYCAGPRL